MMYVKASKGKYINRWVDQEYLIKKNQKPCTKMKKVIDRGRRSKALSEVKPDKIISKNLQSFLEMSYV